MQQQLTNTWRTRLEGPTGASSPPSLFRSCKRQHAVTLRSIGKAANSSSNRYGCRKVWVSATQADGEVAAEEPAAKQEGGYDVYVYEPQPLKEGEEKHTISIFVADEAGLINRVSGVFARRGANIESLAVGLTQARALFTVVVNGTPAVVSTLVKQLSKLVKVRYVEDVTPARRVERELIMLKLRAPAGPARTEVLQLAEIFRARVVDVSERYLTLSAPGDPGKTAAMQKVLSKFGIVEVARTGRICLKRGDDLLENLSAPQEGPGMRKMSTPYVDETRDADVYVVDDEPEEAGVWEVQNILEPTYGELDSGFEAATLSIEVSDVPGVLQQVTGVFARRGYNIQSLAVGNSEREGMSRITMVVPGTPQGIKNLIKNINKIVYVQKVTDLTHMPYVTRELMLIKVRCTPSQRGELRDLCQIFRAGILDVSHKTMTLEVQGREEKMKALTDLLDEYGVLEVARTGRIAMTRESGVDTRYLQSRASSRIW